MSTRKAKRKGIAFRFRITLVKLFMVIDLMAYSKPPPMRLEMQWSTETAPTFQQCSEEGFWRIAERSNDCWRRKISHKLSIIVGNCQISKVTIAPAILAFSPEGRWRQAGLASAKFDEHLDGVARRHQSPILLVNFVFDIEPCPVVPEESRGDRKLFIKLEWSMIVHMCLSDRRTKLRRKVPLIGQPDAPHQFGMGFLEEAQIVAMPGNSQRIDFAEAQSPMNGEFQRFGSIRLMDEKMLSAAHGDEICKAKCPESATVVEIRGEELRGNVNRTPNWFQQVIWNIEIAVSHPQLNTFETTAVVIRAARNQQTEIRGDLKRSSRLGWRMKRVVRLNAVKTDILEFQGNAVHLNIREMAAGERMRPNGNSAHGMNRRDGLGRRRKLTADVCRLSRGKQALKALLHIRDIAFCDQCRRDVRTP